MSRSRPKLDTSPIDYDDVVDSPALKGMISFLEFPPGQLPQLDFTSPAGAPETGPPDKAVLAAGTPGPGIPPAPAGPRLGAPITGVPGTGIPVAGVTAQPVYAPALLLANRPRIRRASTAQEGHSFGEQALYDMLWTHGHAHDAYTRMITIGYRHMSELARLTVNNCKANIRSLIEKLAVEEAAAFTHSQARTYRVYDAEAILKRRSEAGLTHYIKSRGVTFVHPDTGQVLATRSR